MIKRLIAGGKQLLGLHYPAAICGFFRTMYFWSPIRSPATLDAVSDREPRLPEKHPDFANINELIPDPEGISKRHLEQLPRPRYLKSHQYFDPRYPKIIHIVRDPRDVVLSEYYFDIKRRAIPDDFRWTNSSRALFLANSIILRNVGKNTATWFYTRGQSPRLLLVTYEALQSEGARQMAKIAEFIGVPADLHDCLPPSNRVPPTGMRELEKKQAICGPPPSRPGRTNHSFAPPRQAAGKTSCRNPAWPRLNPRGTAHARNRI